MDELEESYRKLSVMEYKGYQGAVHYSDEDQLFFGKVMFIPALISYEGTDVQSLRNAFHESVDEYLQMCKDCPFREGSIIEL